MVDVPGNATTTARFDLAIIGLVGSYNGYFETVGDSDWIKVNLNAARTYDFYLQGNVPGGPAANTQLLIRNESGQALATASSGDLTHLQVSGLGGVFYIDVQGSVLEYTLSMHGFQLTDNSLTSGNDTYTSTLGNERIFGLGGNDVIFAGTTAFDIYGGAGSDLITGNGFNNTLSGGTGDDFISGAAGNDALFGDAGQDFVAGNTGNDEIFGGSGDDFLDGGGDNDLVDGGAGADLLFGGTGNDRLFGRSGDDFLNGDAGVDSLDGGTGIDVMTGGLDNDTYVVDNIGDNINELAGQGTADRAKTSINLTLAAGDNIEFFETVNPAATTALQLTGNEIAQTITGNAGSNVLNGKGGNDVLAGGAGKDFFVFNTPLSATTNRDSISDFNVVADTMRLENAVFTGLGAATGTLAAGKFWASTTGLAHDSDDRIIYNKTTGVLTYDSNGSAAGGAVAFAVLTTKPTITAADFFVI